MNGKEEEQEWDQLEINIESMKAAPVVLNALIKYLIDKEIITKKELLEYIRKDQMIGRKA